MFRVYFKDKGNTSFSVSKPELYLSARAIQRRLKQHILVDSTDYPVSSGYIAAVEELGCKAVARSKWMNTASFFCPDSTLVDSIKQLHFVENAILVRRVDTLAASRSSHSFKRLRVLEKSQTDYGYAYDQIRMLNGGYLHQQGYKGKGMEIAIIDAGFQNLNEILLLDNTNIKGMKDFVYQGTDMLKSSDHGLKVLSVMAANRPGTFVGTAPEAEYWLLRSEDGRYECPVEEDYWAAAAEYADSIGADVINTSLGYTTFDAPTYSYNTELLDGKTAFITQVADIAASKGIFVEVSAGNEGDKTWRKIAFPADAEHVLTVGSVARDSLISSFSSRGPTADGRVKPDVMTLGTAVDVIASNGEIEQSNGTSFAGPIMSGLAACLWQACPGLTNMQLLDVIRRSSNRYENPGDSYGYGIPDMKKALETARQLVTSGEEGEAPFEIYTTDSIGHFRVVNKGEEGTYQVLAYSLEGKKVFSGKLSYTVQDFYIPQIIRQAYIVSIQGDKMNFARKVRF
jgi:subtilisin family serine protease